jgi:ATP-dependent DNA helicase PIF1
VEGINQRWVPIIPVTSQWQSRAENQLSRTQLPLVTAWAITIHKSQGLTLERVVVELGPKDFAQGLSFVAISCVKTLSGLAIKTAFGLSHLQHPNETPTMQMLRLDNARRETLTFEVESYGVDLSYWQDAFDAVDRDL